MSTKTLVKFIAAFGILALVLIFLGVNYVPRISAFSSVKESVVDSSSLVRSNYVNERYPRSIALQLSYSGSDYFERHASQLIKSIGYTGSDFYQRHASELAKTIGSGGSEFLNHHPFAVTQGLSYVGSDYYERHPSSFFSDSDYSIPGHKP